VRAIVDIWIDTLPTRTLCDDKDTESKKSGQEEAGEDCSRDYNHYINRLLRVIVGIVGASRIHGPRDPNPGPRDSISWRVHYVNHSNPNHILCYLVKTSIRKVCLAKCHLAIVDEIIFVLEVTDDL
jgi:hypothetical protein